VAVALLFTANAVGITSVLPRLPEIKSELGLSNAVLGLALAAAPLGSLVGGPWTGRAIKRFGSAPVALAAGLALGLTLPLLALAPGAAALASVYLVLGASDGIMDAAMNAHALRVQSAFGRSLISGFHGMWSLGAATGAVVGATCAGLGVPLLAQLSAVSTLVLLALALAQRWRLPGPDPAELAVQDGDPAAASAPSGGVLQALRPLVWVCVLAVLAGIPEDVANAWSTLYYTEGRQAPQGLSGLGFTVFAVAMLVSRFSADRVMDRVGPVRVAQVGGALAALGYVVVLAAPSFGLSVAGFALVGLGIAPAFPTLFHASGHWPGVRTGDGVTVVSWVARLGFLVTPPAVGVVADRLGIAAGLTLGAIAAGVYAALAATLAPSTDRPAR
jgi:MFS family permease